MPNIFTAVSPLDSQQSLLLASLYLVTSNDNDKSSLDKIRQQRESMIAQLKLGSGKDFAELLRTLKDKKLINYDESKIHITGIGTTFGNPDITITDLGKRMGSRILLINNLDNPRRSPAAQK